MGHEPTPSTSGAAGFPAEALGSRWMSRPRVAQCVRGTDTEPPSQAEGASSRMLVRLPFDFLFCFPLFRLFRCLPLRLLPEALCAAGPRGPLPVRWVLSAASWRHLAETTGVGLSSLMRAGRQQPPRPRGALAGTNTLCVPFLLFPSHPGIQGAEVSGPHRTPLRSGPHTRPVWPRPWGLRCACSMSSVPSTQQTLGLFSRSGFPGCCGGCVTSSSL